MLQDEFKIEICLAVIRGMLFRAPCTIFTRDGHPGSGISSQW